MQSVGASRRTRRLHPEPPGRPGDGRRGGGLSLDLAAYYLDWEDIQLLAVVNNFGINANGGTARNLTDEEGITSVDTGGFLPDGARALGLIRPRRVGFAVDMRW